MRAGHLETVATVTGCSDKTLRAFPAAPHGYAARYDELSGRRISESCTLKRKPGDLRSEKFSGEGCTSERKKMLRSTVNYTEASRPYTHGSPDDKRTLGAPPPVRKGAPPPATLPAPRVAPGDGIQVQRTGTVPGAEHLTTGYQATLGGNVSDRWLSIVWTRLACWCREAGLKPVESIQVGPIPSRWPGSFVRSTRSAGTWWWSASRKAWRRFAWPRGWFGRPREAARIDADGGAAGRESQFVAAGAAYSDGGNQPPWLAPEHQLAVGPVFHPGGRHASARGFPQVQVSGQPDHRQRSR